MSPVHTLDLHFLGRTGSIACYLVPYAGGAVLVDPGPASTLPALEAGLAAHGLDLERVTHVLVTHIHLDHVGAAGRLARQGKRILVHPDGAPHLLDPAKLLASATRLFGDEMDALWGEFLPVPAGQLDAVPDGAAFSIGELRFTALHTPGHARHHVAYLLDDTAFTGDVGGVRFPGPLYLRLPFVPPETHFAEWAASLRRIRASGVRRLAVTHYGIYEDAPAHLDFALRLLAETSAWLEEIMPSDPGLDALEAAFSARMRRLGRTMGLDEAQLAVYEADNPSRLCARGLQRYWRKVRAPAG